MEIIDLIGIPYKENGRDLDGLDCYGCAILAVKILTKKILKDITTFGNTMQVARDNEPLINVKKTNELKRGNVIEMYINNELHIGVCLDDKTFIHSTRNQGVRISQILERGGMTIFNIYEVL